MSCDVGEVTERLENELCSWFFHAPSNQCNLLFIFSFFFQEKKLSLTETIKYEINKYMFKFIILIFFFLQRNN